MTPQPCILLAIAHPVLRALLVEQIGDAAEETLPPVVEAGDAASALTAAARPIAAAVLDDAIDREGGPLAPRLRAAGVEGTIVRIGSDTDAPPGVDAQMARPLHLPSLLALLRDGLRARGGRALQSFGRWRFDAGGRRLVDAAGTRVVRLTAKEAEILDRLVAAGGGVVSRGLLLDEVWGYAEGVATHTVETHVYRLRRKLAAAAGEVPTIATVAGGWRLDPDAVR